LTVARRRRGNGGWDLERIYALFPRLHERRENSGNQLSGGEQQMLSIGRSLMGIPSLLLMDEPMEGLAPSIVDQLLSAINKIRTETDTAILVVEQHVDIALDLTSRIVVLDRGAIVLNNAAGDSKADRGEIERLIGVAA
jgi:branched-chain amino acid transport system ATP-binding protein